MEICGYCEIKKDATTGNGANLHLFVGKICRVMEFTDNGDVLVLDSQATGLAMFDKADVGRSFRCRIKGEFIIPPDLDSVAELWYVGQCMSRKGGYNTVLSNMIIAASLSKGKFTDSFLWQTA